MNRAVTCLAGMSLLCNGSFAETPAELLPPPCVYPVFSDQVYDVSAGLTPEKQASLKAELVNALGRNPDDLKASEAWEDAFGGRHLAFRQKWKGYPIEGGEVVARVRFSRGRAEWTGLVDPGNVPDPVASISAENAKKIAMGIARDPVASITEPALTYVVCQTGGHEKRVFFSWFIKMATRSADGCETEFRVFVDARTGKILKNIPSRHELTIREVYNYHGAESLAFIPLERYDANPPFAASGPAADPVVNAAYEKAGIAQDFYTEVFSRPCYSFQDNSGLKIYVNRGGGYSTKSYWETSLEGNFIKLGKGDDVFCSNLANDQDVMVHEFSHGVMTHISENYFGLEYQLQSGALNESFSDVMAVACSLWQNGWELFPGCWKIAEVSYTPNNPGDALRYMDYPEQGEKPWQPDHFSEFVTESGDSGGVHSNSGISNLVYYLLSQGGSHPTGDSWVSVQPIGPEDAAHIWYDTVVGERVAANATFREFAEAMGVVAWETLGWRGWCNVFTAWYAVGVFDALFEGGTLPDFYLTYMGDVYFYRGENDNIVWSSNLSGYAYLFPENTDTGGCYFWLYEPGKYVWISAEVYPKYWDYSTNSYKTATDGVLK
jgi:vibriolysin